MSFSKIDHALMGYLRQETDDNQFIPNEIIELIQKYYIVKILLPLEYQKNTLFFLTNDNKIYGMAKNWKQMINDSEKENKIITSPVELTSTWLPNNNEIVVDMKADLKGVFFYTQSGKVYGLGEDDYERISAAKQEQRLPFGGKFYQLPVEIKTPQLKLNEYITDIFPDSGTSLILSTSNGRLFASGWAGWLVPLKKNNQTNQQNNSMIELKYVTLNANEKFKKFASGGCSENILSLTTKGRVHAMGINNEQMLGDFSEDHLFINPIEINIPNLNNKEKIIDIGVTSSNVILVTSENNIYHSGNIHYTYKSEDIRTEPTKMDMPILEDDERFLSVTARFDTALFVTSKNNVYIIGSVCDYEPLCSENKDYVTKLTKIDLSLEKDEKINKITIGHTQIFITTSHGNFHIIGPQRSILSPGKQPLVTDANFFGAINGINALPVNNDIGINPTNIENQQLDNQDEDMSQKPDDYDDDALLSSSVASPPSIN